MAIYLPELSKNDFHFPPLEQALEDPNGLLAYGGDLSVPRLLSAYRQGIFPWFGPNEPILWWSPAPRAVFLPAEYSPSKSTRKFQRKHQYKVTLNHAFEQVIHHCAASRRADETWITDAMQSAYIELQQQGHAHSVEVWDNGELVGGLYGVAIGQVFCGESMFSLKTNASKIALWFFCDHFYRHNGKLIDCQVMNEHLASLGAMEVSRTAFLETLSILRERTTLSGCFLPQKLEQHEANQ
ncbi:leucyl/phenylalanyl-tRNA--protein transferase [Thaumasiovibrio sp. DFM-14]|uniref:leucyl/phenylalanyl-tRNA--protein transferase n=1 Tax=Thaumasiovibrio sp. DFM-14 TaxID=3384792 RepID=UPI0039A1092C